MSLSTRLLAPAETAIARTTAAWGLCPARGRQCGALLAQCLPRTRGQIRCASGEGGEFEETMKKKVWGGNAREVEELAAADQREGILERKLSARLEGAGKKVREQGVREAEGEEPEGKRMVVRATSWKGMPVYRPPGEKPWLTEPFKDDDYEPFIISEKTTDPGVLLSMVHQTVVELLVLRALGRPLADVCAYVDHDALLPVINRVGVTVGADFGTTTLAYASEADKRQITEVFAQPPVEAGEEEVGEVALKVPENLGFLQLPLADPEIKFLFLKRVAQLSGHYFPNAELPRLHTVNSVVKFLNKASRPKPRKLAETLLSADSLAALPNVKLSPKRVSISERETEVGRWKIIEEELVKRGLPVNADAQR